MGSGLYLNNYLYCMYDSDSHKDFFDYFVLVSFDCKILQVGETCSLKIIRWIQLQETHLLSLAVTNISGTAQTVLYTVTDRLVKLELSSVH